MRVYWKYTVSPKTFLKRNASGLFPSFGARLFPLAETGEIAPMLNALRPKVEQANPARRQPARWPGAAPTRDENIEVPLRASDDALGS